MLLKFLNSFDVLLFRHGVDPYLLSLSSFAHCASDSSDGRWLFRCLERTVRGERKKILLFSTFPQVLS